VKPQTGVILAYLAVIVLQVLWHGLLPAPAGNRNWTLAILAVIPLLLPMRGILGGRIRSMTWGGYLLVLYFVVGVMEAWSNPPQRLPSLAQVALVLLYTAFLVRLTGRKKPSR